MTESFAVAAEGLVKRYGATTALSGVDLLPIALMSLCGLIVGWRIRSSILDAVAGYLLLVAFSFAMIWVGVLIGSLIIWIVAIVAVCAPLAMMAYQRSVAK